MCCSPQISSFPILDIVQTATSVLALILSLYFFYVTNKQFRQNQKEADIANGKHIKEFERLSSIIKNQLEVSEKHYNQVIKLSKPLLELQFKYVNPSFDNVFKKTSVFYQIKLANHGKREVKNIIVNFYKVNFEISDSTFWSEMKIGILFPNDTETTTTFIYEEDRKSYIYATITYHNDVTEKSEMIDYLYLINENISVIPELTENIVEKAYKLVLKS